MENPEINYLTNMPQEIEEYGLCKVLNVRKEVIHIKHIFTEIFVRCTIDLEGTLERIGWSFHRYMMYMTNRLRVVHKIPRAYKNELDSIVKTDKHSFFPAVSMLDGLNIVIVLDFDGVITAKQFIPLYNLCIERAPVEVCTANPDVSEEWFVKHNLPLPRRIHAMKGMQKKLRRLLEIQQKYDHMFYIDNEIKYLEFAWVFGIDTYHWIHSKIKVFSLNTK